MTIQEFDSTAFGAGMTGVYNGRKYDIGSCDFSEKLIGLVDDNTDDLFFVRCENVTLSI